MLSVGEYYCIARIDSGLIAYCGQSLREAADAHGLGTASGIGDNEEAAKSKALLAARDIRWRRAEILAAATERV